MRLSELTGKEIINVNDGLRLSFIRECDLVFDERDGKLHSILLPPKNAFGTFFNASKGIAVPWKNIKKIGAELIIVDMR